ncbi:AlpA family transcriptional regulator [Oceanisphaera sediminis]|jgi:prophage regulatory protein|uniref:Transcriptional regulator n=2 Tax=Aeromonadaceae TaxID=84642 RepID=A0A2P7QMH3_9GAMM|nr:AlpA family transcriptional regulator [Zobellella taiwanensis]PSJ39155.1 transcriptional regulator [Zobellella taiwanensis]
MRFLRLKDVIDKTGLSRSTIYRQIAEGCFPKGIPLGGKATGWLESEIEDWMLERLAKRNG